MRGWLLLCFGLVFGATGVAADGPSRPNILWLTCEDTGPHLGCYGDPDASTPHLDRLAARGLRYRRVWSVAPVCAPARTAIISGLHPRSTGSEHMRSLVRMPAGTRMFPELLREAGYHCSNNSKEDYNLVKPGRVWDESSARAHWKARSPGQPFFAVFNFTESHESQIRRPDHQYVHDPAKVRVPPYMPDTPEVRAGWAQYQDQVSVIDARVGRAVAELEAAGLAEDTLVFFFGDHGSGMPRNKRSACDSGLRVPLLVHFPARWRHLAPPEYREGGESERLVSFLDLAPTVLNLAGAEVPAWLHGRAFAGPGVGRRGAEFLYGERGRMDERYDLVRSVTDGRHVYVRNYFPHRPHGQPVDYMFQTPATVSWKRLYDQGRLDPVRRSFWEPRAPEELYDLGNDPFETVNLAADPAYRRTLARLRRAHLAQSRRVGDVDLLPEAELLRRAAGGAPGDWARTNRALLDRVLTVAERAAGREEREVPRLLRAAADPEAAVRWWAALGLLVRGKEAVLAGTDVLGRMLEDPNPSVRIMAAEALATHGTGEAEVRARQCLLRLADARHSDYFDAVAALNAVDSMRGGFLAQHRAGLASLPRQVPGVEPRVKALIDRLLASILGDTGGNDGP